MKQYFLSILFFAIIGHISAQVANDKVNEVYTPLQLKAMTGDQIQYLNFLSEKGSVVSYAPEKSASFDDLMAQPTKANVALGAVDASSFNLLAFDIIPLEDKFQSYRIGDSGYVVTIYSQKKLDAMYDKYTKSHSSK